MQGKGASKAMYQALFAKGGFDFVEGTFLANGDMSDNYDSFMEVFNATGDALKAARNTAPAPCHLSASGNGKAFRKV